MPPAPLCLTLVAVLLAPGCGASDAELDDTRSDPGRCVSGAEYSARPSGPIEIWDKSQASTAALNPVAFSFHERDDLSLHGVAKVELCTTYRSETRCTEVDRSSWELCGHDNRVWVEPEYSGGGAAGLVISIRLHYWAITDRCLVDGPDGPQELASGASICVGQTAEARCEAGRVVSELCGPPTDDYLCALGACSFVDCAFEDGIACGDLGGARICPGASGSAVEPAALGCEARPGMVGIYDCLEGSAGHERCGSSFSCPATGEPICLDRPGG